MKYSCAWPGSQLRKDCIETHREVVGVFLFLCFLDFMFAPLIFSRFFPGEFAAQKPPRATQWLSQQPSQPLRIHRYRCGIATYLDADHVSNTDVTNGFGGLESTTTSASKIQLQGFRLRCGGLKKEKFESVEGGGKKLVDVMFYFCWCFFCFLGWFLNKNEVVWSCVELD